jgi:hypothetical protein
VQQRVANGDRRVYAATECLDIEHEDVPGLESPGHALDERCHTEADLFVKLDDHEARLLGHVRRQRKGPRRSRGPLGSGQRLGRDRGCNGGLGRGGFRLVSARRLLLGTRCRRQGDEHRDREHTAPHTFPHPPRM